MANSRQSRGPQLLDAPDFGHHGRFQLTTILQPPNFIGTIWEAFGPRFALYRVMRSAIHIAIVALTMNMFMASSLHALPRSADNVSATPKHHFDVKMVVNKVDLGESFELELSYSPEECASFKNILSEMRNARVKKLDEDFFQNIGLSSQVFEPFIRIYEKTRSYSFEVMLSVLQKKGIANPMKRFTQAKQDLIKGYIAAGETTEEELDQLSGQERDVYQFLKKVFNDYIQSGNKALSQEFHFNKLERFLLKEIHNTCENRSLFAYEANVRN